MTPITFVTTTHIEEPDLLDTIAQKLEALKNSGRLTQLQFEERKITTAYIERPKSVSQLAKATVNRNFYYDPTVVLSSAIQDASGHVLYPAGTRFNPLSQVTLHTTLLFFDADDETQVRWAQQRDRFFQGHTKIILINGSLQSQMKQWQRPIYFDQAGSLVKKLQITHVPAQVTQSGQQLLIEEHKI